LRGPNASIAGTPAPSGITLSCVGLLESLPGHAAALFNAEHGKVALLLTIGTDPRRFVLAHGRESCGTIAGLSSTGSHPGVLVLKVTKNGGGAEGGGVHGRPQRSLQRLPAFAEGIQKEEHFDMLKIDGTHIHESCMHGDELVSAMAKGKPRIVSEIEAFLQQDQLGLRPEFLMPMLKLRENQVQGGEVGDGVVICHGDVLKDESAERAVIGLPDLVCLGMSDRVGLG